MIIESLIIVFIVTFGNAFMKYKNKQKIKQIKLKIENRVSEAKKRRGKYKP